ncbi:hypothetical protein E2P81_ATG00955 [Venturia nashicola]|nr:hypothetical protein E2P81_ATG00955 [Venturia nashicola]
MYLQKLTLLATTLLTIPPPTTATPTTTTTTTKESGFALIPLTSTPPQLTNPSHLSAAISRISAYQTSLTAQPHYASIANIVASAMSKQDLANTNATTTVWEPATTYFGVPTGAEWWSEVPEGARAFFSSVVSVESRLATGNGAVETVGVGLGVGMGFVVGGLGVVLAM